MVALEIYALAYNALKLKLCSNRMSHFVSISITKISSQKDINIT